MPLIANIEEAKKFVRLRFINSNASMPDFDAIAERYIIPIMTRVLYDSLLLPNPGATKIVLLNLVKTAVVPLAYYHELPNIHVQIGDMGVTVQKSDNTEAVHRWEFEQLRNSLADKGCAAINNIIVELKASKVELNWQEPEFYKGLVSTAEVFNQYFNLFEPHRTFESLRPIIKEVEDQYIIPSIGIELFEILKNAANPDGDIKAVIQMLRKSIVNYTISKACDLLPIRINHEGFTVALSSNADGINPSAQNAPNIQFSRLKQSTEASGDTYLLQAKDFLNEKASAQLFQIYFNSKYYKPINTTTTNRNEARKSYGL